jgi:glyoxylase-like metal-dependent hydrolase (beta-lactamase superfamily II)
MVKVLDGLYSLDHSEKKDHSMESWILNCKEGVVIVDVAMKPADLNRISDELSSLKKSWKDVDLILITHKHGDHVKNLPKVRELTKAPIKAHKLEAPLIEKAVGVNVEGLEDGEKINFCGGIEVIWIPGHSEGNACYYLKSKKAIIVGDTIFGDSEGNLEAPPEKWCLDAKQAAAGIKRLLSYDFNYLLLTHGKDVMGNAKQAVVDLVNKMK